MRCDALGSQRPAVKREDCLFEILGRQVSCDFQKAAQLKRALRTEGSEVGLEAGGGVWWTGKTERV